MSNPIIGSVDFISDTVSELQQDAKNFLRDIKNDLQQEANDAYEQHVGFSRDENGVPLPQGRNDALDAYRHAYTSARVTQIMIDNQWISEYFGNDNEIGTDHLNDPYEHRMDLWNNELGRRIGDEVPADELGERLAEELTNGDLVTSIEDGRLESLYGDDPRLNLPETDDGRRTLSHEDVKEINADIREALDTSGNQPPSIIDNIDRIIQLIENEDGSTTYRFINPETGEVVDVSSDGSYSTGEPLGTDSPDSEVPPIPSVPPRDPLSLDLNQDGEIGTVGIEAGAFFDLDNNGFAESTSWIGADDGFVVLDRNGDGAITNGGELFGTETLLSNGEFASNGFEALAELDSNKDGVIDKNDEQFAELRVWRDANTDGISTADELMTLDEAGVVSIDLAYTEDAFTEL